MRKEKYSEIHIKDLVANSASRAEVLRKLGYKGYEGGGYRQLAYYINKYNIDIAHLKGQGWSGGLKLSPRLSLDQILTKTSRRNSANLKKRLVKEGVLEYRCATCAIDTWNGHPISLHLDHINGDHTDHTKENLRLLCPNCHSQTHTYCRSKKFLNKTDNEAGGSRTHNKSSLKGFPLPIGIPPQPKQKPCPFCSTPFISTKRKFCSDKCYHDSTRAENGGQRLNNRKTVRPSKEELAQLVQSENMCAIGRKYGVSDNAIRKWCKYYGIEYENKKSG